MKRNRIIRFIVILLVFSSFFVTLGYSAMNRSFTISGSVVKARVDKRIRITEIAPNGATNSGTSQYEEYDHDAIVADITLPNENSTVTYAVTITNYGNIEMLISSIDVSNYSSTLNVSISNYSIGHIIQNDANTCLNSSSGCKLGIERTIYVTVGYKNNAYSLLNNYTFNSATIKFNFETIDSYASKVEYNINSLTGEFSSADSELYYDLTITNKNAFTVYANISGSSNTDITYEGTYSNLEIQSGKSVTKTIKLSPAKQAYTDTSAIPFDVNVQVVSPNSIDPHVFAMSITPFSSKLADKILENNTVIETTPSYTGNVTSAADSGLFKTTDESGTTYFYRGIINNNYVYFANKMWRIIRINGDGTYRIILNSSAGTTQFSTATDATYNVGYMYGSTVRANTNSSNIKTWLENWYTNNLQAYDQYIDKDAIFWQDRTLNTSNNVYAGWTRIINNAPSVKPTVVADMFSVTNTKGNGLLNKPIGLITADEVVLAGGTMTGATSTGYGTYYENKSFYLHSGDTPLYGFWTMTPRRLSTPPNNHMIVSKEIAVIYSEPPLSIARYVKPVINLKKDIAFSGSGTSTDPYIIVN